MHDPIDRRTFVRGAAGITVAGALGGSTSAFARAQRTRVGSSGAFAQGVASGEPSTRAISLWTRLSGVSRSSTLGYEVARDRAFERVVVRGQATADAAADFTAHVRVSDRALHSGQEYFYRFFTQAGSSDVGRFRTARPADSRETVRIAFFSCQEYIAGFYQAHADLASRDDIDLVVCLGDYVYEQGFASTAAVIPPVRPDDSGDAGDVQTLPEYREKYNLYNTDPDLRAMRAAHPLVAIWDDHEVEDNYADGIAGGATEDADRRVSFAERKRNGYRAFFEHLPRRLQSGTNPQIYGRVPLGAAEVFLLDERQYRDDQPCNPGDGPVTSEPCPPDRQYAPRTLLGDRQKAELKAGLSGSKARWKVVANQVMVTSIDVVPTLQPLNADAWDGYARERRELIDFIAQQGIEDVTFITGDIHTFFAGDVTRTGRQAVRGVDSGADPNGAPRATEFVGGAISSPGIVDRFARTEPERNAAAAPFDAAVLALNPQITYANQAYKGYAILEASRGDLRVDYRAVRDARDPNSDVFRLRRFRVQAGRPIVIDEGGPVPLPDPALPTGG
ncbi:MAG: alkaline phosphatase D family protein, partial [Solirubrobacterales bacterium]|nr:alkaline phosphatase D family protein [Solirubrobacterales bacterium]